MQDWTDGGRESSAHLVSHRPSIKIANSTHAPDSLGAIALRAKLAAKVADMEIDASIERRELSVKNILNERLAGQNLPGASKRASFSMHVYTFSSHA
jgi:hypothetical protein